jgi:hypothetical protein
MANTNTRRFVFVLIVSFLLARAASAETSYEQALDVLKGRPMPDPSHAFWMPNCVPTNCLPCLCLQSVYGTGLNPNNLWPCGAFNLTGLVSGRGVFTWESCCYSAQMRYCGQDANFWYYSALCTRYCFAVGRQPLSRVLVIFIYDRFGGGPFVFYEFATTFPCASPCWTPCDNPCYSSCSCSTTAPYTPTDAVPGPY